MHLLLTITLLTTALSAQQTALAHQLGPTDGQAYTDTLSSLVVFVQFRDDATTGDRSVDYRQWPVDLHERGTLPDFANHLIATSPSGPFADSTLSGYFHKQSEGRFVVYGDVYPQILLTRGDNASYHRPAGGYADLTREVVARLDSAGVDFTRYDHNGDGVLDNLIVVLRTDVAKQDGRITYTGISCLHARCGGGVAAGPAGPDLYADGIRIDWDRSGSFVFNRSAGNIDPQSWIVRMIAHEMGHDIWAQHFVHIPPIADNDVPGTSNRGRGTRTVGYVLMAGAGGGPDARGDQTISAFERLLLGWIECPLLDRDQRGIELRDLYTEGGCYQIRVPTSSGPPRYLVLSNRQRIGFWDRPREGGRNADGTFGRFELGLLRTTGLLVMLTDGRRLDVLPADNTLDLSIRDRAYEGDLWGPRDRQITPWTIPNTSGYGVTPPSALRATFAIDNIRYADDGVTIVFDFVSDFFDLPTVRRASRTPHGRRDTVRGPLRVAPGATLEANSSLRVEGPILVEPRATLVIAAGASVAADGNTVLSPGARVVIAGSLETAHLLTQAGSRVDVDQTGTITLTALERSRAGPPATN